MKDDLISRQAAIDTMTNMLWHYPNECYSNLNKYEFAKGFAELGLKSVPSAQPERKEGKWNVYYHGINEMPMFSYSCNQCGYSAPYGLYDGKYEQKKWRFCPNCGAKMRGEQDEMD